MVVGVVTTEEIVAKVTAEHGTIGPEHPDPLWDAIRERGHYDRQGKRISMRQWIALGIWDEQNDNAYRRVARTKIGSCLISTVWLGIDHGYEEPLIFETMVFPESEEQHRYTTEEEALAGHQRIVEELGLLYEATR